MSFKSNFNRFFLKITFYSGFLFVGFFLLTQKALMQEELDAPPVPVKNAQPTPAPPKSTVRGRVVYADSGRPVRRASLMFVSGERAGKSEKSGLTNERGEFEIKDVSAGRYYISVNMPGVLSPISAFSPSLMTSRGEFDQSQLAQDFQEVVVNGVNDVDVTVVAKRGAVISGRVIYADGEAAVGVRIEILRKKNDQYGAVVPGFSEMLGAFLGGAAGNLKTDDRGGFRVAGLPAGEYIVRVVENVMHTEKRGSFARDFALVSGFNSNSMLFTYFPNTNDIRAAEVFKLELGQELPELNITIPDRTLRRVSGVVLNKTTRQPVKGVKFSLKNTDSAYSLFGNLPDFGSDNTTDEQGNFSFKEIPAGKYTLVVQPPEYNLGEYDDEGNPVRKPNAPKQPKMARTEKEIVVAEDADLTNLTVEMNYGAIISGTVAFEKNENLLPLITVTASDSEEKFSERTFVEYKYANEKPIVKKTDEFRIEGLPNGKVFFRVSLGRSDESGDKIYVKSVLLNGKDIREQPLEIKEGEEIKNVQLILASDGGSVKGKVADAEKRPVAGLQVMLVPTDKRKWANRDLSVSGTTDGEGEFEISGAPDEYFIIFLKKTDSAEIKDENENKTKTQRRLEKIEKEAAGAEKVVIRAKETTTVNLKLP